MKIKFSILLCYLLITFSSAFHQVTAQHIQLQESEFYFAGIEMPYVFQQNDEETLSHYTFDTLYSFPAPGTFPLGLAWDGQYFWNLDNDSLMIYKLTTTGDVVSSFPIPDGAGGGGLEWDGNYLWLADESAAILFKIDTTTGLSVEQFHLPSFGQTDPNGWGLAWDGQYLWHSEYWDSAMIYKLDPQNGQVVSSFSLPDSSLILGITWAEGFLYGVNIDFASSGGTLYKFEPSSGVILDSTFWEVPYPLGLVWDGQYFWNVSSRAPNGNQRIYQVSNPITLIENDFLNKSNSFVLLHNYPNPFNPSTTISYSLPVKSQVDLVIYNTLGESITQLVNEEKEAGKHSVEFNATSLPSGVYFYRLQAGSFVETKKMVLMK